MQNMIEIGNKISVARKLKNMSQSQLATQMSVTSQAVGKWERGESMPDIITFGKLATILGVDLNYFGETTSTIPIETSINEDSEKDKLNIEKTAWDMSGGNWKDADFSGLNNLGNRFSGANIENCKFVDSELSELMLRGNHVEGSDFSRSDLSHSKLHGCNIEDTLFNDCNLSYSKHAGLNIQKCEFDRANFTGVLFKSCNIQKISVVGAKWIKTVFKMTNLTDIVFDGEFVDCAFEGLKPSRVIFRNVTFKNTFFKNCNLKKLRFENCKADSLTLAFLKNNKADISEIICIEKKNS